MSKVVWQLGMGVFVLFVLNTTAFSQAGANAVLFG